MAGFLQRFLIGLVSAVLIATQAGAGPVPRVTVDPNAALDAEPDCGALPPAAMSVSGVSDDGARVTVRALVVLDGITRARGRAIMTGAAESYDALDIDLASRYRRISFAPDDFHEVEGSELGAIPTANEQRLFDELIEGLGGERPSGSDVVLLLTDKDIYIAGAEPEYSSAGVAYCLGGIRYADKAFAIAEGRVSLPEEMGAQLNYAEKIAAHEIGHLLGGQHNYANCVEGNRKSEGSDQALCTLMEGNLVRFLASNFGTLDGNVVRGYAIEYAGS
jgi:Metallo-peptidase family M12B Reprolysin-like